jgi:4-amino-4-deoxy-L-arabinose transferase-like glycosyltransferase
MTSQPPPIASSIVRAADVSTSRFGRQDWAALIALALLFAVMLAATWQRWAHPIIDHGREMHVPLRILTGERLYIDIPSHYGPFAPHFNALLYSLFGVHLNTLHMSGAVCAVLILLMIYRLARELLSAWEAALATALVLVTCALAGFLGNYIQPYSYAALYGWAFALAGLVCLVRYVALRRRLWMFWAGVCIGASITCKPELGVHGLVNISVAWMLTSLSERRWLWSPLALAATPVVVIGAITYGLIMAAVPWQMLITDAYRASTQPQMVFFAQVMNGTQAWPHTGWALLAAVGMSLAACGLAALLGLLLDQGVPSLGRRPAWPIWVCLGAGAALWASGGSELERFDVTPLRSAPLVLGLTIAVLTRRLWRRRSQSEPLRQRDQVLLLIAIFSFIAIGRVVLNLSLWSPYTAFTAPTLFLVYGYLFFDGAPAVLLSSIRARGYARNIAMVLTAIWLLMLGIQHAQSARFNDFELAAERGRLWTDRMVGQPIAAAIQFAAARTQPGDYVLSLPQGSIINFLSDRRNPLKEEIIVPGFLTPDREAEAIRRVQERRVGLILVANHLTPEYRDMAFGFHYNQAFMRWIEAHYHPVATFRARPGRVLQFGDFEFFIRAYERNADGAGW